MLFDGYADVYSTCRKCRGTMRVVDMLDLCHPCCDPDLQYTEQPVNDNLGECAVLYAKWGWPVFPLRGAKTRCDGGKLCQPECQCSKKPATRHGFQDASTDVVRVKKWWDTHPHNNIGLATGHCFDAIDVDPKAGGNESFAKLLEQQRIPPVHALVRTGTGGQHLYILVQDKPNGARLKPGLDYRGMGGYVVAPPSVRASGHLYTWLVAPSPVIRMGRQT